MTHDFFGILENNFFPSEIRSQTALKDSFIDVANKHFLLFRIPIQQTQENVPDQLSERVCSPELAPIE